MTTEPPVEHQRITCQQCKSQNPVGALLCRDCGALLFDDLGVVGNTIYMKEVAASIDPEPFRSEGPSVFNHGSKLFISIERTNEPLELEVLDKPLLVGRQGVHHASNPDIDLADYGGREKGVSRKHALLQRHRNRLIISDLDSANGTYINGIQLEPEAWYQLRSGDEVRLGRLMLWVNF